MLKVGEVKEVKVMLLDNDGNPTDGTITYTVYDENDVSFTTGTMSAVAGVTGFYTMSFTPDAAGAWSVLVTCSDPNRTAIKMFDVGVGVEQDIYDAIIILSAALVTHDSDIKTLLGTIQTDLDNPNQYKANVSALALEATLTAIKGSGWSTETLKAIKDAVDAIAGGGTPPADIWNYITRTLTDPDSYKADVSSLALEVTLATHNANIEALINALNNLSTSDIWTYGTRTLTDPDSYKADVSALALEVTLATHDSDIKTLLTALQNDLDNPNQYKADVSALALEATLTAIKGGGWSSETLKAIYDAIAALNDITAASVWNYGTRTLTDPDSYKANISSLALEATLTAIKGGGWSDETLKAIKDAIDALTDASASDVWNYGTRTLTDPNSYKADVSALALEATLATHDSDIKTLLSTIQTDLDNPAQYKADVSALALEATLATHDTTLGTHDTDIKALLEHATYGLSAIETLVDGIETDTAAILADIGDFSSQTYLKTLLAALGIPDVSGKSLYTCLITDRLDHGTYGLSALKTEIDANETKIDTAQSDITAIKAKTDNLPASPAPASEYDTEMARITANVATEDKQDTMDGLIDAIVAQIDPTPIVDSLFHRGGADCPAGKSIWDALGDATVSLNTLKTEIDANETKIDTVDTAVTAIKAETDQLPNWRFEDKLSTTPTVDAEASDAEQSLTAGSVTPTFPTGATRQRAYVVATLHVANKSAATHKIGLTLQKQKAAGGYTDIVDLTANPPISLVNIDGATTTFAIVCDVTALVDTSGAQYDFKWLVDSDNAGAVNYTSNFVLVIIYSM